MSHLLVVREVVFEMRIALILLVIVFAIVLHAEDVSPVDVDDDFRWDIHLIAIPLVLLFGIFIGWSLHERKSAADQARRELNNNKS